MHCNNHFSCQKSNVSELYYGKYNCLLHHHTCVNYRGCSCRDQTTHGFEEPWLNLFIDDVLFNVLRSLRLGNVLTLSAIVDQLVHRFLDFSCHWGSVVLVPIQSLQILVRGENSFLPYLLLSEEKQNIDEILFLLFYFIVIFFLFR